MPAYPPADPHPDGGDLVEARGAVSCFHPNPGQSCAALAGNAKPSKHIDDPSFKIMYIAAHIWPAFLQVKHDIRNPLTRSMIGPLTTATGFVGGGIAGIEQIGILG